MIVKFIILVIIIVAFRIILPELIKMIKEKNKNKNINFERYDDIDEVDSKIEEKAQLENELKELRDLGRANIKADLKEHVYEDETTLMNKRMKRLDQFISDLKIINSVEVKDEGILEAPVISSINENITNFDAELFKKWSKQLFIYIQIAEQDELEKVKTLMSDELYDKIIRQLNNFNKDGLELKKEDMLIKEFRISDYGKGMNKEEIQVTAKTKLKEYILKTDENKIVRGSDDYIEKNYVMIFIKKNISDKEGFIHNCPNCGAEIAQTEFGKCMYCNTFVIPIRYNWTLIDIKTI